MCVAGLSVFAVNTRHTRLASFLKGRQNAVFFLQLSSSSLTPLRRIGCCWFAFNILFRLLLLLARINPFAAHLSVQPLPTYQVVSGGNLPGWVKVHPLRRLPTYACVYVLWSYFSVVVVVLSSCPDINLISSI